MDANENEVTHIINTITSGDHGAVDQLIQIVYQELRQLAVRKLQREKPGQTLQATALVHEAYLRLLGDQDQHWRGRSHFFSAAAEAMRRILVDKARYKKSLKRGKEQNRVNLEDADLAIEGPSEDMEALNEALDGLTELDAVKAELVKLRYFAGLSLEQAAEALNLSETTAKRHWRYSRAWLYQRISSST